MIVFLTSSKVKLLTPSQWPISNPFCCNLSIKRDVMSVWILADSIDLPRRIVNWYNGFTQTNKLLLPSATNTCRQTNTNIILPKHLGRTYPSSLWHHQKRWWFSSVPVLPAAAMTLPFLAWYSQSSVKEGEVNIFIPSISTQIFTLSVHLHPVTLQSLHTNKKCWCFHWPRWSSCSVPQT